MARRQRAEAHQVLAAKVSDRAQQIAPITQPSFMLGDGCGAVAVLTDLEPVAPIAASTDVDRVRRSGRVGAPPVTGSWGPCRVRRGTAQPLTCGVTRCDATTLPGLSQWRVD